MGYSKVTFSNEIVPCSDGLVRVPDLIETFVSIISKSFSETPTAVMIEFMISPAASNPADKVIVYRMNDDN